MATETRVFEAETRQLLDLVIHSLYTEKEIFLRELISNASDALDRLRFESLTEPGLIPEGHKPEIRIETDPVQRTLTISDTGIGMSRDEVIAHIGTIAKSGTAELRTKLREAQTSSEKISLIGQFGVGFYSAFMVADRVKLLTRRAGQQTATVWESAGDGTYSLAEGERDTIGTSITLYLKKPDTEAGIEDYCDRWRIESIVRRHSDFISYPIIGRRPKEDAKKDEGSSAATPPVLEDHVLNSRKPIWSRPSAEVTKEEYAEFYKHLSHDWEPPLKTIPLKAEGLHEYQALLFIPSKAPFDLFYHGSERGLRLLAKSVVVMERCEELLPRYLRFMRGAVDSADLPLNISRQRLQQDRHITQIRKWLTRKTLETLAAMAAGEPETYLGFWKEFGRALKEGVSEDYDNREKVLPLLLFESSNDPERLTTLKDYVSRMKEGQDQIYYLTGESRVVVENSPHLESVRDKGYEVLFLTDAVDELLVDSLPEVDGKKLKSVGKGAVELGTEEERKAAEKELEERKAEFSNLLEAIQKALDAHVKSVRLSHRLTNSPACLVVDEHEYSPHLERLLGKDKIPKQRRILELNPKHPIVTRMLEQFSQGGGGAPVTDRAELVYGLAALAEGSEIPNPVRFGKLVHELMERSL